MPKGPSSLGAAGCDVGSSRIKTIQEIEKLDIDPNGDVLLILTKQKKRKRGSTCDLCSNVPELPHRTECGHSFCFLCIDTHMRETTIHDIDYLDVNCPHSLQSMVQFANIYRLHSVARHAIRFAMSWSHSSCHTNKKQSFSLMYSYPQSI